MAANIVKGMEAKSAPNFPAIMIILEFVLKKVVQNYEKLTDAT